MTLTRLLFVGTATIALGACNLAPAYRPPAPVPATIAPLPAAFKADPGWAPAMPADDIAKGAWWRLFNDPVLDGLEARVAVTNQNVAAARAAWAQARAVVAQNRAALFPTVGLTGSATRNGRFGGAQATTITNGQLTTGGTTYSVDANASWEPDLWGKLTNTVRQSRAQAEASAADLANATLSAQAALASDYMALRADDAEIAVLDTTIMAEAQAFTITGNQYAAGTVSRAEVDAAEQTLASARASRRDLDRVRTADEDAIAVLVGDNPSTFHLAADPAWQGAVPEVPGTIPARLLQRRPDIAAAERNVAAANAAIGIARAAFFPDLTLSGSVGSTASSLGSLFGAATSLWSLGASAAETLLDFGARSARVRQARAAYDQAVATYRQTVLTAFQTVEDNLAARAAYADEAVQIAIADRAAQHEALVARNELAAGTLDGASLAAIIAQANNARQSAIQSTLNRQLTAIALVAAIGGTWADDAPLPTAPPAPVPPAR